MLTSAFSLAFFRYLVGFVKIPLLPNPHFTLGYVINSIKHNAIVCFLCTKYECTSQVKVSINSSNYLTRINSDNGNVVQLQQCYGTAAASVLDNSDDLTYVTYCAGR